MIKIGRIRTQGLCIKPDYWGGGGGGGEGGVAPLVPTPLKGKGEKLITVVQVGNYSLTFIALGNKLGNYAFSGIFLIPQ